MNIRSVMGLVTAAGFLVGASGCGTSPSHQVSASRTTSVNGCPSGTVSMNEDGTIHCLTTKKPHRALRKSNASAILSSFPAGFHYWTRQHNGQPSHNVGVLEGFVAEPWWSQLGNVWKGLAPIGIQPSAALGIGVDLSGNTSASSGLAFLREARPDPSYVLFLQSPKLPLSHHAATLMAAASAAIVTAFSDAFPQATQWPALIVRWQGPHNEYVQLGESGSYADAALENSGLQAPGWAVGTGIAAPSTPLSWDPTGEDLSQIPAAGSTDSLYRATGEMVHGVSSALDWMSTALYEWGRSSSSASNHSTTTVSSPSSPPSSAQTSNANLAPSSSPPATPSPRPPLLDISGDVTPQGIQVQWSAYPQTNLPRCTVAIRAGDSLSSRYSNVVRNGGLFTPPIGTGGFLVVNCGHDIQGTSVLAYNYGVRATGLTGYTDGLPSAPEAVIYVSYNHGGLGYGQTPDQNMADYQVTAAGGTVWPVSAAQVSQGMLVLTVHLPPNTPTGQPVQITVSTAKSVATDAAGAPSLTDVQGSLNTGAYAQ